MIIVTSYFSNFRKLAGFTQVSIALWPPRGFSGQRFPRLAPPQDLLREWKAGNIGEAEYTDWFRREILDTMPERDAVIKRLSGFGDRVALLCFEKSGAFCHRNLVAERFRQMGIPCQEFAAPNMKPAFPPK